MIADVLIIYHYNVNSPNGGISLHVLSDMFKVDFIRKKCMRTYTWKENLK